MSTKRIQVALAGASGYTGMETLRYLQYHPVFEVVRVYGNQSAGNTLDSIYPAYAGVYDMTILPLDDIALENADAVILALPHGRSAAAVYKLLQAGYKGKIIDIGSDFRLKTSEDYLNWYNLKHPHPELLDRFSYGFTGIQPVLLCAEATTLQIRVALPLQFSLDCCRWPSTR